MRNFKKFLTLVLAVMMVVSAMSFTTSAAQFEDVSADNEYLADAVSLLNYMGVAKGVSETKFGTDELVTRQQFALFIYRLMKGGKDAPANGGNVTNFKDLTDPTYNYAIGWAAQQGIVTGRSATTFDPKGAITLQEAYTMIVRALKYEADGEKLQYPFGYIEVAEAENVDLAEGLASTVDYTDALTRGDMAILLYNAFFAEMGVATIEYDEYTTETNSYLIEKEVYPILCEDIFGVSQVEYKVVATPHYQVKGHEATKDLGYAAVLLEVVEDDNIEQSPAQVYLTAEDLGVEEAELDDLFLAHFELFVTHGDKISGNMYEIDKVLYANSAMTKKTVNELKFATVATNKATSYFAGTDAKLLSGKATAGSEVIYFYDAPYSYAAPNYGSVKDANELYNLRNDENIGSVEFKLDDPDAGIYEATITEAVISAEAADYEADGIYDDEAVELVAEYTQAYYGGLFEADIYDVDGDGLYDYIDYKPYYLFQVDTDDEMEFSDNDFDGDIADAVAAGEIPVIYTNEATLLGEKFENEDYVIGYYDNENNVVKVATVLKPVTATIKSYKGAEKTITLSDNTTVAVDDAWKYVVNYAPASVEYDVKYEGFTAFDALLHAEYINDEEINLYIYDGVVFHQEGAKSANLTFTNNLIIPTTYSKKGVSPRTVDQKFDADLGEYVTRIYAWVDGDLKWVTVETEDVYPAIINEAGNAVEAEYLDQLCTYTVDADGIYTITSLENALDEDDKHIGINWGYNDADEWVELGDAVLADTDDDDLQFLGKADNVYLTKFAGTRFDLEGADLGYRFNFTDYTKIIIKNTKHAGTEDEKVEYIEYDATTFNTSSEVELNNVAYIVANDADSTTRENLVVLYAEAEDFDLKGAVTTTGYRIIANSDVNIDENDYYRNYYTVYDPFTGKRVDAIGDTYSSNATTITNATKAIGSVVELKDGKVDESEAALDTLDINSTSFLVEIDDGDAKAGVAWIAEYSESDKIIMLAPVGGCWNDVEEGTLESYQVDNNTAVSMIKYADGNNNTSFAQWGAMSLLTTADLGSTSTDYKCFNTKVEDSKGNYKTGYAKYIKAYVVTENEDNLDDGELNKVTMVVILVNGNEPTNYLTTHTAKLHEGC